MEDIRNPTDPTALTTQQIFREIASLKELVFSRMSAIEKGIEIAHDDLVRVPTEVQKQVGNLKELLEIKISDSDKLNFEKFKNIDKKLDIVEQARIEQKNDTARAVEAALRAAKEAVTEQNNSNATAINKSEASITKQMDQQAEVIRQITKGFDEKINDMKERLSRGDGKNQGIAMFIGWILAAIAIVAFLMRL